LVTFFEYGRSIEGKLARTVGTSDATASLVAAAGWRVPPLGSNAPTWPREGSDLLVAVYGQSFSGQVGEELARLDPTVTLRKWGGPAAPPNAAYGLYLADRGPHQANVVILGVLASEVARMDSTSAINTQFEAPAPYTYPKFLTDGSGGLATVELGVRTLAELREVLADPARRDSLRDAMRRDDPYFAPFLFDRNLLDSSALVRMVRRAAAHHHIRAVDDRSHALSGFMDDAPVIATLRLLVVEFAASARRDGKLPVLLLFNNRGFADHLYVCLADTIAASDIPYVSSHTVCSANDPTVFIGDGHFTPEIITRIARALVNVLDTRLHRRDRPRGIGQSQGPTSTTRPLSTSWNVGSSVSRSTTANSSPLTKAPVRSPRGSRGLVTKHYYKTLCI
jgi:hypothetical protein